MMCLCLCVPSEIPPTKSKNIAKRPDLNFRTARTVYMIKLHTGCVRCCRMPALNYHRLP